MGVFDRIILTIYTFFLAILSVALVVVALGNQAPLYALENSLADVNNRWILGILGMLFFLTSLRFLWFSFHRSSVGQAVVHETGLGEVKVSLGAVKSLVERTAGGVPGIKDVRAVIFQDRKGDLGASVKVVISPDASVPKVSDEVQKAVRAKVREVVGTGLDRVNLKVENISNEPRRARVE